MLFLTVFNLSLLVLGVIGAGMCMYALFLAIKALKIYIKKNT
jgi:hypothetical protein